jgi:hypothetical protein
MADTETEVTGQQYSWKEGYNSNSKQHVIKDTRSEHNGLWGRM